MRPSLGYRVRASIARPPAASPEDTTVNVGYARVSTQDQDLSAQLDALRKAGGRHDLPREDFGRARQPPATR
jgi:predicted site-specific integrase-resolvase